MNENVNQKNFYRSYEYKNMYMNKYLHTGTDQQPGLYFTQDNNE